MIRREFVRLFYQHMEIDSSGRYLINWRGERCYVAVEDTPFVIYRVVAENSDDSKVSSRFTLFLSDDSQEDLLPDTLHVGDSNVLYCKIRKGTFPARFNRAAYYQLAAYIEEDNGRFYLPLDNAKYFIPDVTTNTQIQEF
ncbi:MAG: hypothetical protein V1930_03350 [Pseudomonadota bacterium]